MSTVEVAVSAPHPPGSGAGPDARRIAARLLCQQSFRQHLAGIILASQPWLTMPALEREAVDEPNRFDRHRAEPEHRIRHGNAAVNAGRGPVHARSDGHRMHPGADIEEDEVEGVTLRPKLHSPHGSTSAGRGNQEGSHRARAALLPVPAGQPSASALRAGPPAGAYCGQKLRMRAGRRCC